MTTISPNWNTDLNYWELHPGMKNFPSFKILYDKDKSKSKIESSKVMWAIALMVDPHEKNPWKNVNPLDKKMLISIDYLQNEKFNWDTEEIVNLIEEYKDKCLTVAEKALIELQAKLAERAKFIKETNYTLDWYEETEKGGVKLMRGTAPQLDKMMTETKKIYDHLDLIKKQIETENISGSIKGGAIESASEKGEL